MSEFKYCSGPCYLCDRLREHIHNGKHRSAVAVLHDTRKNRDYKERS